MKYRGFYIDETETTDVLRPTETGSEKCDGIWFRLYADSDYGIQIDDFIGAYGHEIENSEESVEQFVKGYILLRFCGRSSHHGLHRNGRCFRCGSRLLLPAAAQKQQRKKQKKKNPFHKKTPPYTTHYSTVPEVETLSFL